MQSNEFEIGTMLEMLTTDGSRILKLLEIKGDTLYVCSQDEANSAIIEQRSPRLCGFNRRFALRDCGKADPLEGRGSLSK